MDWAIQVKGLCMAAAILVLYLNGIRQKPVCPGIVLSGAIV
jgi:hypothetical protein